MKPSSVPAVNYQVLEHERTEQSREALKQKLKAASEDGLGGFGSLRRTILGLVISENYERGKQELKAFVEKRSSFPNFQFRVEKFVKHATEIIHAIQTKRSFPGLGSLSMSKQQELNEKVIAHFDELKLTIRNIERADKETRLHDMRSTVYVVKTVAHCVMLISIVAFVMHMHDGLWYSFQVVFDALANDLSRWIEHFMGWAA